MDKVTFYYISILAFFSLPVLIGWGYLLYLFLKKIFGHRKKQKLETENKKILFYNLWLPLAIGGIFALIPIALYLGGIGLTGSFAVVFAILSAVGLSPFFGIFYLLYHLFYWLITKFFGGKYYGGRISIYIFFVSLVIMFLCVFIMLKGIEV